MQESKRFSRCKAVKPSTEFYRIKSGRFAGKLQAYCKECGRKYNREWDEANRERATKHHLDYCHEHGIQKPMDQMKECALYLGVHIAERVLSNFFDHIKRMPHGNPGYDFICDKGYKIDVKSSCMYQNPRDSNKTWRFSIQRNKVAEFFLCIAFDNRSNLTPMHVWLIPGNAINHLTVSTITNSCVGLSKWKAYERPLDRVQLCCNKIRGET